jgi:dihydroorotate dehydrogenase
MGLYSLIRPLVFALEAERAHRLTIAALKLRPAPKAPEPGPSSLAIRVAGLDFPNPIGLAPGFDKDAEVFAQALGLGFGFVEVGTLTPRPQAGNARPRLFRLAEDQAVINRMGFNNHGQAAARERLTVPQRTGIVGVNIGANKDSTKRAHDYAEGVRAMAPVADYLTINISSPNTPGLRDLQDKEALEELLTIVTMAGRDSATNGRPPVFLKVAPDLEPSDIDDIARAAMDFGLDALIVSNTTISRPPLRSHHRDEQGGLSGAPLKPLALQRLRDFRKATGGGIPLIGVGGIGSGRDAYERIRAGASLVQLYSALVFEGPGLVRRMLKDLTQHLEADGFSSMAQAIGTGT